MDIRFDPKTTKTTFKLDEQDIKDAHIIDELMRTEAWKRLMDYFQVARESLIDSGKVGIRTRARKESSDLRWAILHGFDEFMSLPKRIVNRAEQERAKTNVEGTNDDANAE